MLVAGGGGFVWDTDTGPRYFMRTNYSVTTQTKILLAPVNYETNIRVSTSKWVGGGVSTLGLMSCYGVTVTVFSDVYSGSDDMICTH